MAYTDNEKSTGLEVLTTLATGDLHIVGDVSDSGRAKAITQNNLEVVIANSTNFVDELVANNYFTTELAADTNFISELTTNTTFQSAVNNFVTVVGSGSGVSSGKPMSFYPKLGISSGNSINGYQDREAVFSATSSNIYLADPTGNSQKRDIQTDWADATFVRGYALIGLYLYVLYVKDTATTDARVYRYTASDLSLGGTLMTVSGATLDYATDIRLSSNGTYLFMSSDGGASANSEDIAKFSISGTTLTYVSTTTCTTTTASFGGAFSVDTAGNYYSTKDGETQTIYVCDSTGTQTSTQSESFQMSSIMNWGNTLYGYNGISEAWSKLYMPATDTGVGVEVKPTSFDVTYTGSGNQQGYVDRQAILYSNNTTTVTLQDRLNGLQSRLVTTDWASADAVAGYVIIGAYLYLLLVDNAGSTERRVYRYLASDLSAGGTQMTIAGQAFATTATFSMTSDGVSFYFNSDAGSSANKHEIAKYSLSGTTLTYVSTTTCGSTSANFAYSFSVDSLGRYLGYDTGTIYLHDSSGTLLYSVPNIGASSSTSYLNWTNTIYFRNADISFVKLNILGTNI